MSDKECPKIDMYNKAVSIRKNEKMHVTISFDKFKFVETFFR